MNTFRTISGSRAVLPEDEADFLRDPDAYAARRLGLSSGQEYRTWLATNGTPLCAAVTLDGHACRNPIGPIRLPAQTWREKHRTGYCYCHKRP